MSKMSPVCGMDKAYSLSKGVSYLLRMAQNLIFYVSWVSSPCLCAFVHSVILLLRLSLPPFVTCHTPLHPPRLSLLVCFLEFP